MPGKELRVVANDYFYKPTQSESPLEVGWQLIGAQQEELSER